MSYITEKLKKVKDDRGTMANLRCSLVESKKHRAWPSLYRIGIDVDDEVGAFVAGLFAMDPDDTMIAGSRVCFGRTCKTLERRRGESAGDDAKLTPTEKRFQAILVAERGPELHTRVLRLARMAQREGIAIDFDELEYDLRNWNDQIRNKWASAFWSHAAVGETEEAAS